MRVIGIDIGTTSISSVVLDGETETQVLRRRCRMIRYVQAIAGSACRMQTGFWKNAGSL